MGDVATITLRMLLEHPLDIPMLQWALFALVIFFVVIFMYLQMKHDSLDLRWLILDRPHRPSLTKIAQVTALIVSTWAFAVLTLKGSLTETFFIGYMVTWSGSAALDAYLNKGQRTGERASDGERERRGQSAAVAPSMPSNPYDDDRG